MNSHKYADSTIIVDFGSNKPMEKDPSVSIIIVNWNNKILLQACLASLKTNTVYSNFSVIVVDNGSSDGSAEWVKRNSPWINLIALDKNSGFSVGNNRGIAYALKKYDPEYVLLLNNDTEIVQADWLRRMVTVAESEKDLGILGCKLIYPDGKTQYIGTKITVAGLSWIKPNTRGSLPEVFDVDATLGACFLIKRIVINKIGFFDVGFSPFQDEESDYCMRARKIGYKTRLISTVKVVHIGHVSLDKINPVYINIIGKRNTIRFMLLNFPASWLVKRVPYEIRMFVSCFITRNRNSKRFLPVKLRDGKEMAFGVRVNFSAWLYNLKNLKEIVAKRKGRALRHSTIG